MSVIGGNKHYVDQRLNKLDWQESVLTRWNASSALPTSPVVGARYLCKVSGNGWTANNIYEWGTSSSAYVEIIPDMDFVVWVEDEQKEYIYNGSGWGLTGSDLSATPNSHTTSGTKISLTTSVTVNFGDVCYINSSGLAALINANGIATMSGVIMCADESILASAAGNWLVLGVASNSSWTWVPGGLIYGTVTGTTGNTLSQTAPTGDNNVVQILGVALTATTMLFNPNLAQVEILV